MKRFQWNPYSVKVDDEWVEEYKARHSRKPKWIIKILLHVGLFLVNVEYFFRGEIK